MSLSFCSIIRKSQLAFARVLWSSLHTYHPDAPLFVLLVDEADGELDLAAAPWTWVGAEELELPNLSRLRFGFTAAEQAAALKPFLLRWLLGRTAGPVVYLDPETLLFSSLCELEEWLRQSSLLLFPNLLGPLDEDGLLPDEISFLSDGAYNTGIVGVSLSEATTSFLDWWADRVSTMQLEGPEADVPIDQKWCDLAPTLHEAVRIVRHPAYGATTWNRDCGELRLEDGVPWHGDVEIRSFQFQGIDTTNLEMLSGRQRRYSLSGLTAMRPLFEQYADALDTQGHSESRDWPYSWDTFDGGAPVPLLARRVYLHLGRDASSFGDPFATGPSSLYEWFIANSIIAQ